CRGQRTTGPGPRYQRSSLPSRVSSRERSGSHGWLGRHGQVTGGPGRMNPKITASALKQMHGKRPDELVSLKLRTNMVLSDGEFQMLTGWGGKLLYDNGMLAVLHLPVGKVNDIAAWACVIEVM